MKNKEIELVVRKFKADVLRERRYEYFRAPGSRAPFRVLMPAEPSPSLRAQVKHIKAKCRRGTRKPRPPYPNLPDSILGDLLRVLAELLSVCLGFYRPS